MFGVLYMFLVFFCLFFWCFRAVTVERRSLVGPDLRSGRQLLAVMVGFMFFSDCSCCLRRCW